MVQNSSQDPLDERPLPHAVGPEKSVLSTLLKEPAGYFPRALALGITADSFYLPAHSTLFGELRRLHEGGQGIELVSLVQKLLDRGLLDRVGGPATVTDLYTYAPTEGYFAAHAALVRDKEIQRATIAICREGIEAVYQEPEGTDGHLGELTSRLRGLSENRPGAGGTLREMAYRLRFDPAVAPPGEEVCLLLGDIPVAARGNITVLQGKSKVGKSAAVSAILGAALASGVARAGDCLGFRWLEGTDHDGGPGVILHIDTEQSPGDWHALVARSLKRAGLEGRMSTWLVSLPLVTFARSERLTIVRQALEHERKEGRRIALVIIDGIADLCASPNDEAEGLEIVSRVLALSHEYRVPIATAIHENPGTDMAKTRGHLGSELNRKAFANLRIDKDSGTGVSVIYGTDMRKREIPKEHGFCFAWDDKAGMHVSRGRCSAMKAKEREEKAVEKAREEWEAIFEIKRENGSFPFLTIQEAIELERESKGKENKTSETTMKKRLQRGEVLGVLRKTGRGTYLLNPKGKKGNEGER